MEIYFGTTRCTILIGKFAIKIPRLCSHLNFLKGCLGNWKERDFCKQFKCLPEFYNLVVPSIFCSWFGLVQVQYRCDKLKLTDKVDLSKFKTKSICSDLTYHNFGYYKGELVCLDYADD